MEVTHGVTITNDDGERLEIRRTEDVPGAIVEVEALVNGRWRKAAITLDDEGRVAALRALGGMPVK